MPNQVPPENPEDIHFRIPQEEMERRNQAIRNTPHVSPGYADVFLGMGTGRYGIPPDAPISTSAQKPKPALSEADRSMLIKATHGILENKGSYNPRPSAERRERDYIAIIQNAESNRQTPREMLYSEQAVYLPYIDYDNLQQLQPMSRGRLYKKDSNWYIRSSKTDLEIPIDYAFMCMGGFYEATEVPNPQLCARCDYVRPECTLHKDYLGKDMFLCSDCAHKKFISCNSCSERTTLPYFSVGLCESCINRVSTSRPFRNFYLGVKWLGSEAGKIIQSPRVFSFEMEAVIRGVRTVDNLGNDLVPEAGLSGDSSICGDGVGVEVQSPQLSGARGEELTARVAASMKQANSTVNESCGMHVHLDGDGIIPLRREDHPGALKDLWKAHIIFEDVIFSFLPFSRRLNRFCRPMRDYFKVSEIELIQTMFDAEKLWYKQQDAEHIRSEKQQHHHASRYFGVNLHSLFANNHLELRHHSATLNAKKVLQWANLHALIMDAAQQGQFTQEFLANAQATTGIKDKTIMLFDAIKLGKQQRQYFYQRQAKFSDKVQQEDEMNILPLPRRDVFELIERPGSVTQFTENWIVDDADLTN